MLWYLLYPLRGTSEPPVLKPDHPIRRAFYRHGKTTATHWLVAMLVSVAIGVILSYPTVFLSDSQTAGFTTLPHHVWTSAKPFDVGSDAKADVELHQVWVHGSYMKALEKPVLENGLLIQQALVDGKELDSLFSLHRENGADLTWAYHSPLMYWNNSYAAIEADTDILNTINERSHSTSFLNFTLRPTSVFAGKLFSKSKLLAADALVITLFDTLRSGAELRWLGSSQAVSSANTRNWTIYPEHGEQLKSRIYEFSFQPLSLRENVALALAYACMVLYVIISLLRLKAFRSRLGLVVTAVTQMTTSILASLTICGMVLRINLAQIPQNAYPFVVLIIGLENMFRLINAVLQYPAEMKTDLRIANAVGDVGYLSVATAAQNLAILWLLSRVVSSGVAAFCAFAAVALLFDLFFLLTFFVAVLNVDIRRLELQDSIARPSGIRNAAARTVINTSLEPKSSWFDALVQGRLPVSTRMAGTAVTTTFVLSLNYHFFDGKMQKTSLRHLFGLLSGASPDITISDASSLPPMNATRTAAAWLRMQDYDTAKEVMRLVKPGGHSLIARIFDPLIVVIADSDRTGLPLERIEWQAALRTFAVEHFYPFAVAVVFVVAFVTVLMNFLLWNEERDDADRNADMEEALSVQSISLPHHLDIVKIAGCESGHFVTVSLDRSMVIALRDRASDTYQTLTASANELARLAWPIHALAVDSCGKWVACHCADDRVVLYNVEGKRFMDYALQYPDDHPNVLFTFVSVFGPSATDVDLVILTSGGRFASILARHGRQSQLTLSDIPLLGSAIVTLGDETCLLIATDTGKLIMYAYVGEEWTVRHKLVLRPASVDARLTGPVKITPVPEAHLLLVLIDSAIIVVDLRELDVTCTINIGGDNVQQELLVGAARTCPICDLKSPALATMDKISRGYIVRSFAGKIAHEPLCLHARLETCNVVSEANCTRTELEPAGASEVCRSGALLGIRSRLQVPTRVRNGSLQDSRERGTLRRRYSRVQRYESEQDSDEWEVYSVFADGHVEIKVLEAAPDGNPHARSALFVNDPGPACALDRCSVAVALGNEVKVVKHGRRGRMNSGGGTTLRESPTQSRRRQTLSRRSL